MTDAQAQTLMETGIAAGTLISYSWGGLADAIAFLLIVFVAGVFTAITSNPNTDQ